MSLKEKAIHSEWAPWGTKTWCLLSFLCSTHSSVVALQMWQHAVCLTTQPWNFSDTKGNKAHLQGSLTSFWRKEKNKSKNPFFMTSSWTFGLCCSHVEMYTTWLHMYTTWLHMLHDSQPLVWSLNIQIWTFPLKYRQNFKRRIWIIRTALNSTIYSYSKIFRSKYLKLDRKLQHSRIREGFSIQEITRKYTILWQTAYIANSILHYGCT